VISNKQSPSKQKKVKYLIPQIMKKTALIFGIFSLVMVATSFTTPETVTALHSDNKNLASLERVSDIGGDGTGGATGGTRKLDLFGDGTGGATGGTRKLDVAGDGTGGATGGTRKLDYYGDGTGGATGGTRKLD
jgi:hypothetical protein